MTEKFLTINDIVFTLNLPDIPSTKANPAAFKRAFKSAADAPIAKSLPEAVRRLQGHKLHVSTDPCTQAICDILNNLKRQKFMMAHNSAGKCSLHPFLALAAISEELDTDIYVFSTVTRPFHFQARHRKGTVAILHDDKDQCYPVTRQSVQLGNGKIKEPDYPKAQRRLNGDETLAVEKLSLDIDESDLKSRVHQAMVSSAIDFYEKHHLLATGKKKRTKDELKEKVVNARAVQPNFWNNLAKQLVAESLAPTDILGYHVKKQASANENWVTEWATYVTEICDKAKEKPASEEEQRANRLHKSTMHKIIATPLSYALRSGLDPAAIAFALDQEQQNLSTEIGVMAHVLDALIKMVDDGKAAQCFGDEAPMAPFAMQTVLPTEFRKSNAATSVWLPKEEIMTKMREEGLLSYRHLSRLATVYLKTSTSSDKTAMKRIFTELKKRVPIPEPSTKFRQRAAFQTLLRELRSSRFHIWQKSRFLYDLRLVLRLSLQAHLRPEDLRSYLESFNKSDVSLDAYGQAAESMRLCDRVALGLVGQHPFSTSTMVQQVAGIGQEDKPRRRTKEERAKDGPMSREVLISLLEIAMKLCQSADIEKDATKSDILDLWKRDELADDYIQATLSIINALRPFVPKSNKREPTTYDIFSCAPIHSICELMLQQLGAPSFPHQESPKISVPLNASMLYDIFSQDYVFFSRANRPITNMKDAALKKDETIGNFFNPDAIHHVFKDYQLTGTMRYIDHDTTLWYGTKLITEDTTSDEVKELDDELIELKNQHKESNKQVIQVVHQDTQSPEEQVWEQWSVIRNNIRETRTRKYTLQKELATKSN